MGCSIVNHPSGGTPIYSIYGTPKSNQLVSGSSCQEDLEEKVVQILTQVASATQMQGPSRVQQGHFVKKNIGNMVIWVLLHHMMNHMSYVMIQSMWCNCCWLEGYDMIIWYGKDYTNNPCEFGCPHQKISRIGKHKKLQSAAQTEIGGSLWSESAKNILYCLYCFEPGMRDDDFVLEVACIYIMTIHFFWQLSWWNPMNHGLYFGFCYLNPSSNCTPSTTPTTPTRRYSNIAMDNHQFVDNFVIKTFLYRVLSS